MQRAMLKWNDVPTQVVTEGRWVEEGLAEFGRKDVIIVITGNPGIAEFYGGFIKMLKLRLPSEVPIWVIGHAGHIQPPNNLAITMPSNSTWNEHYSLMAQIQHKIDFIKKYVPEDAKLHLIGHSVGSWLVLNMLKDDLIVKKVTKCYLLFPTIENMYTTTNGQLFTKIMSRFASFIIFLSWVFSYLPHFMQIFFISIYELLNGIPLKNSNAILQLLNPDSLKRVIKMAKEEMEIIKERDDDIISKYANKLWFYYGNCDGWTPIKYYEDLKSKHPYINAKLCKHGYHHSFVLQYEKEMAKIVGDAINENM
ncbi:PREDICTED: lipid droplet-associated hydrolase [Eufriesea mexicana]|uniref:lipid droplet-associated hydrolase n=1 Tax=Eufriesea mexicana TaxID=516756 RepID=UPI00083BF1D0|nr:PREDICTED: lipid droplet-associated hydrolase [Eufriesea mexicana]XP_017763167.1 PREDICTED: lipid droplet-associated hydrolase [Eufriesea mexicana]